MGMGIVSDQEFESQLSNVTKTTRENKIPDKINNISKVITPEIVELESPGRKDGDNNVPDSLRSLIGSESVVNGRASAIELAKLFKLSPSSVSAYSNGSTSTASYDKKDEEIVDVITRRKSHITKRALSKLQRSLHHITDQKLELLDGKELASVAKDMSAVAKNMEPPSNSDASAASGVKFVIFTPEVRMENSYESITVNE